MFDINSLLQNKQFRSSIGGTFIIGLMAHAFFYFNIFFSHDSLMIYHSDDSWKVALGRYITPFYRNLRSPYSVPWLIGLLSLIYLTIAVYFLVKLFDIQNIVVITLIGGMFATNYSLTAINATYMHDADVYTLAIVFYILSAYLLINFKRGWALGSITLALALGLYQAYIPLTVTVVLLYLIKNIFNNSSIKEYIVLSIKFIGMVALAYCLYKLGLEICLAHYSVEVHDGYNGIASIADFSGYNILNLILGTYVYPFEFLTISSGYNTKCVVFLNMFILVLLVALYALIIFRKKLSICNKVMAVIALLLMPFALNCVYFISKGMIYNIMVYQYCMVFFLLLFLFDYICKNDLLKHGKTKMITSYLCYACVTFLVFNNISYANDVYLKKELDYQSTLLTFNRLIDRIETVDGYSVGNTEIVLVGSLDDSVLGVKRTGFEELELINQSFVVTYHSTYQSFIKDILNYPIIIAGEDISKLYEKKKEVMDMPVFPYKDCMKMIDGKLIVKLSE